MRSLFKLSSFFALVILLIFLLSQVATADVSTFSSDDFNSPNLDTSLWTFVNPLGDATVTVNGHNTADAHVSIALPNGPSHDPWSVNESARIMQPATNTDFEIEVKFESGLSERYEGQGVLVEQDADSYLRFDFYSDGSGTRLYAASIANGSINQRINNNVAATNVSPLYMRIRRQGNQWSQFYSVDGQNWVSGANFNHALSVSAVGAFAGNFGSVGNNAPAHTAVIDYFFNTAAPITPEDSISSEEDTTPPNIFGVHHTSQATELQITWSTDEPATGKVEYGETLAYELGSVNHTDFTLSHTLALTNLQPDTTYNYRALSTDANNNNAVSNNFVASTSSVTVPPPGDASLIDVWYGPYQVFGQLGIPQPWVNILGNITDFERVNALRYSLNSGPQRNLTIGHDQRRLAAEGDFNVDLRYDDLQPGLNTVVITADTDEGPVSETVTVEYQAGNTWPQPYTIDWGTVTNLQDVVQVVDGLWSVQGDAVRTNQIGYDRILAIGDVTWTDFEVEVPITMHQVNQVNDGVSNGAGIGLMLRWEGHYDWDGGQPVDGWWPYGAIGWYGWGWESQYVGQPPHLRLYGNAGGAMARDLNYPALSLNVPYIFKMRAETQGNGTFYGFKVWEQGQPEPADWDLTGLESLQNPLRGSLLLIAHNIDTSFGDVSVTPLGDPSPLAISNLQATAGLTSATISWTTNQPATSSVSYGSTAAYEDGIVSDNTLVTQHSVTLSGLTSDSLYHYQIVSEDSGGNSASTGDLTFSTTTNSDSTPPIISNIEATPGVSTAIITWITNEPATSSVAYGPSSAYELGALVDNSLVTNHSLTLSGLSSDTQYHYQITSADADNNAVTTVDLSFTTFPDTGTSSMVSDDFNACGLNTALWTFVNPLNDASVTTNGGHVQISVPAGPSHDPWVVNEVPRLMQPATNTELEMVAKFDSPVTRQYQSQGILIEQDSDTYVRFDFYSDGSNTHIFAATFNNGSWNIRHNSTISGGAPLYMRVQRQGNNWLQSYSQDGQSWVSKANFSYSLNVSSVGVFAGNFSNSGSNAPAHLGIVDYVFNTASPIVPEDAGQVLTIDIVGNGAVAKIPNQSTYTCGDIVQLTGTPSAGWNFGAWSGNLSGNGNPADLTISGNDTVTATFTQNEGFYTLSVNPVAGGVVTVEPALTGYSLGQVVTLTATVDPGWSFSGWSGDLIGSSNPATLTVTGDHQVTATFAEEAYTLTANTIGDGLVTVEPAQASYTYGQVVTVTATADPGWSFSAWAGDLTGSSNPMTLIISGDHQVTATFAEEAYSVSVLTFGNGTIEIDPLRTSYNFGEIVTLTATADTAWGFSHWWDGSQSLSNNPLTLTVSDDHLLIANFIEDAYTMTVNTVGDGTITVAPVQASYTYGQVVTLTATANPGWNFSGWSGDLTGSSNPTTITVTGDQQVTATFAKETYALSVNTSGNGAVTVEPALTSYSLGQVVTLTATADPGWSFSGWSGDLIGSSNPATLTVTGDHQVTANYSENDTTPPDISNIQVVTGETSATISWTTNEPASSGLTYGISTVYESGTVSDGTLVDSHALTLLGLTPDTTYHYQITSTDENGNSASSIDLTFVTSASSVPLAVISDDFSGCGGLNTTLWSFINPLNDAAVTVTNGQAQISVPAGPSHDPWTVNETARIMQGADNVDFDLVAKFDSLLSQRYQSQGVLVQGTNDRDYIRFDFYSDGSETHIFAATFKNGSWSIKQNRTIAAGTPLYMRVERNGNSWVQSYSVDGQNWTTSTSFNHALSVTSVGVFAGNFGDGDAPAHTAVIDYFFNYAAPIVPEDGDQSCAAMRPATPAGDNLIFLPLILQGEN